MPLHRHPLINVDTIRADAESLLARPPFADIQTTAPELLAHSSEGISCLVEPFLQKVGLVCLAGSSDTGKSALLRQLSIAVAAGDKEFLGFVIRPEHHSVIYVSTEDGREATSYLMHWQTGDYPHSSLDGLRFVFDADQMLLSNLGLLLSHQPADMVVVDCFADAFGGDLKDTQKIRAYLQPWQSLSEKYQCLILFLHHTAKRTEALPPSKNNLLSGQGFEAKMRLVIELRADPMYPHQRHFCIVKGNYLSGKHKKESYVLHFDEQKFLFSQTGRRMPFELLVKNQDVDESKARYEQAKELKEKGLTYTEIARMMGYSNKSSVSSLFAKARKEGWEDGTAEEEIPF